MLLMNNGSVAALRRRVGLLDGDDDVTLNPYNLFKPLAVDPAPSRLEAPLPQGGPEQSPSVYASTGTPRQGGLLGRPAVPEELKGLLTPEEQASVQPGLLTRLGNFVLGPSSREFMQQRAMEIVKTKDAAAQRQQALEMEAGRKRLVASIDWSRPDAGQRYVMGMMQMGADPKEAGQAFRDFAVPRPAPLGGNAYVDADGNVRQLDPPPEKDEPKIVDGVLYEKIDGKWVPQTQRRVADAPGRFQIVQGADGQFHRVRVDGPEGPVGIQGRVPGQTSGRTSAMLKKARIANDASLAQVRAVLSDLERAGPSGEGAVGWKAYIPDPLLNRWFPEGVETRSGLQNVGSIVLHDRFGAALTKTELQRAGFIPFDTDNAATAKSKISKLIQFIEMQNAALDDQTADEPTAKTKKITVNGKTFIVPDE